MQNAQVQRQQAQHQQTIANILMQQQQQAQAGVQSSPNANQAAGASQQNLQAAMFAAQAQRQQAALAADSSPQTAARSSPNLNGAAPKPAGNNGLRIESIMQNLPSFIQMMEKGQLSDLQVQQVSSGYFRTLD